MQPITLRIVRLSYWLIRLRWYAILGIIAAVLVGKYLLHISIALHAVTYVLLFLTLLNAISYSILKYLQHSHIRKSLKFVKQLLKFQMTTDLIVLTVMLHYSGGVENPFIIYYIFHMIIGSIILSTRESLVQTSLALLLVGAMSFLEYSGVLPHYPLEGFITSNMAYNLPYLICTGLIFITTSYLVVYITRTIVKESEKHEKAYHKANLKLKQKDKIKDEYVMRITHDIKGHIAAIQSCLNVLDKKYSGPMNPQQEEFVERAYNRTLLLNKFAANLLSLTQRKLKQKPDKKYFDLPASVRAIINSSENYAREKNISITPSFDEAVGNIYGEQASIEEVIQNLINNAIKYSPPDTAITVSIQDKQSKVLIEVADNGFGIPEGEIDRIFDEFYRASNVMTQIKEGTGLGLAIAKHIVENHGGKICVKSKTGEGSTFSVLLKKDKE